MPASAPVVMPEVLVMLHKLSLLMTGLVLVMGVAWFGIEHMSVSSNAAAPASSDAAN
jgi:hypothetical protein